MGRIAIFEVSKGPTPSPVVTAFLAQFPEFAHHSDQFSTLAEIEKAFGLSSFDATLFHWEACPHQYYLLEGYWQDPKLCTVPLFILSAGLSGDDKAFIEEYGHVGVVTVTSNLSATATAIRDAIAASFNERSLEVKLQNRRLKFFQKIHSGHYDEARSFLDAHMDGYCSKIELEFYRALVMKARKQFDEAVAHLITGMRGHGNKVQLEPRFLHLIGNIALKRRQYDQAIRFLEAANKMSPKNLRRHFLLGQSYLETGEKEQALKHFMAIYKLCPYYPSIHSRMVELLYERATELAQIEKVGPLLRHVPDRALVTLYKTMGNANNPDIKRRMLELTIREFSLRANDLIAKNDFYAALSHYSYIGRIIDKGDAARHRSLAYCYARVYFRGGDYDLATEHINKAMDGVEPAAKILTLKALIERAKAGDIRPLTDEEAAAS